MNELYSDLLADLGSATGLTNDEEKIARLTAKYTMIAGEGGLLRQVDVGNYVKTACKVAKLDPEGGDHHRSAANLYQVGAGPLWDWQLLKHVVAGMGSEPWLPGNEPFAYLSTRQYHQAYQDQRIWYRYNNAARTSATKLSGYSFRSPSEFFAELYSCYFASDPVGSNVPLALKKWFQARRLHKG